MFISFYPLRFGPLGLSGNWRQTCFSQTFREPPRYPGKILDVPAQSLFSLGFEVHAERFGPHHFTRKTPTPSEDIRTKMFEFVLPFLAWFSEPQNRVQKPHVLWHERDYYKNNRAFLNLPKGPSRTDLTTETNSVVFYYSVVILLRIVIHYWNYRVNQNKI